MKTMTPTYGTEYQLIDLSYTITSLERDDKMKSVAFAPYVKIHEIPHKNDMLTEEKSKIWLCKSDFRRIRADIDHTCDLILKGDLPQDDSAHCFRGTEFNFPDIAMYRFTKQQEACHTVLAEQKRLKSHQCYSDTGVALAYQPHSVISLRAAIRRAEDDMFDVQAYLESERRRLEQLGRQQRKLQERCPMIPKSPSLAKMRKKFQRLSDKIKVLDSVLYYEKKHRHREAQQKNKHNANPAA